jgi:O-antigen/teichoic acid export membrane protein
VSKEFLLNLVLLLSVNVLIKPLYAFGVDMQVQSAVGNAYGLYFALWNFSCLFQMLADLGIQQYNNREVAANSDFFQLNFGLLLRIKAALALLMVATALLFGWLSGYDGARMYLLVFLLLNQVLISLTFYFRSCISGLGHYRLDSLLSSLDKFLLLIFGFLLLYVPVFAPLNIHFFVYSQTLAYLITAIVAAFYAFAQRRKSETGGSTARLSYILRSSLPYAVAVVLMMGYNRIDAVLLERILPQGAEESSKYAFAYRFFDMGNMVGFLFAGLLLPMFTKIQSNREAIIPLLRLAGGLIAIFTLGFSLFIFLFAAPIQSSLSPALSAAPTLKILILALNAGGIVQIWGTFLTAQGQLWRVNILFSAAIILNISLNLWLIRSYGAVGAAIAAVVTQSFVAVVQWGWVALILRISWSVGDYLRWISFFVGLFILVLALSIWQIFGAWQLDAVVFCGIFLVLAFVCRVFRPFDIVRLLRQR